MFGAELIDGLTLWAVAALLAVGCWILTRPLPEED